MTGAGSGEHSCQDAPGDCPDYGCDDPAGTWWPPVSEAVVETDRLCEDGCGCRYGTDDPDARDCACGGPCQMSEDWGCLGRPDANCGGACPKCEGITYD